MAQSEPLLEELSQSWRKKLRSIEGKSPVRRKRKRTKIAPKNRMSKQKWQKTTPASRSGHADWLSQGSAVWNKVRKKLKIDKPVLAKGIFDGKFLRESNLSYADLKSARCRGTDFSKSDITNADLRNADMMGAIFRDVDLSNTDLRNARFQNSLIAGASICKSNLQQISLREAKLVQCDLSNSDLRNADLRGATLQKVNLENTNLDRADLRMTHLIECDLSNANVSNCSIYGISTWGLILNDTKQENLIITLPQESTITVDNIDVAQFMYLIINNKKIRDVIDTVSKKVVLILGRFTRERKMVLTAIKTELRNLEYLPIMFDFEPPASRDITETVSILAHIARFIIADITDAKSIPQELQRIIPDLPSVPVQPILQRECPEYGMFEHFKNYPWVMKVVFYKDLQQILNAFQKDIIRPLEEILQ